MKSFEWFARCLMTMKMRKSDQDSIQHFCFFTKKNIEEITWKKHRIKSQLNKPLFHSPIVSFLFDKFLQSNPTMIDMRNDWLKQKIHSHIDLFIDQIVQSNISHWISHNWRRISSNCLSHVNIEMMGKESNPWTMMMIKEIINEWFELKFHSILIFLTIEISNLHSKG